MKPSLKLTFGEELANAVSHGPMFLLLLGLSPWEAIHTYLRSGDYLAMGWQVIFSFPRLSK